MTVSVSELAKLANTGDLKAMLKLRELKKEGRHIRAYPDGRLGWWDEGKSPFILVKYFDGSVILTTAYANSFFFAIPELGSWIVKLMGLIGSCYALIGRLGSHPEVDNEGWFTTEWRVFDGALANPRYKYGISLELSENENAIWELHPQNLVALLADFEHLMAVNEVPLEETGLDAEWIKKFAVLIAAYRRCYE